MKTSTHGFKHLSNRCDIIESQQMISFKYLIARFAQFALQEFLQQCLFMPNQKMRSRSQIEFCCGGRSRRTVLGATWVSRCFFSI